MVRVSARSRAALAHEAIAVDHHAGDLPGADDATRIAGGHGELEATPVDPLENRLGVHLRADRGRLEVVELDAHADRGRTLVDGAGDGVDRRLLAQGDQPGRTENLGVARPQRLRSVGLSYPEARAAPHAGLEVHAPQR